MSLWKTCIILCITTVAWATSAQAVPEQQALDALKAVRQKLALNLDPNEISVSGISSGGFMAHQFHVAHSRNLMGAGIIAGGPYNCAQGSVVTALRECTAFGAQATHSLLSYTGPGPAPQGQEASPEAIKMATRSYQSTLEMDRAGKIDSPGNILRARVILVHGQSDRLLPEGVMDAVQQYYKMFYKHYGVDDQASTRLHYLKMLPAEHSVPSDNFINLKIGSQINACKTFGSPYLNVCTKDDCANACASSSNTACSTQCVDAIDTAGEILRHIYNQNPLKPRNDAIKASTSAQSGTPSTVEQNCQENGETDPRCQWLQERIFVFDQPTIFSNSRQTYLGDKGFLFVPKQCRDNHACKLHIAFHGCEQGYDFPDSTKAVYSKRWSHFVENVGFNEWADANDIVVFYPQARTVTYLAVNPKGCWDFWGYTTNALYPTQQGRQISAVWEMVEALVPNLTQ